MQPDLASIEPDRILLNYAGVLKASKRKEYRAEMRLMFTTFIKFLQDEELVTRPILEINGDLADNVVVRREDLKDDGVRLFFSGWEEWCDFSGSPAEDVEYWKRRLLSIREEKGPAPLQ